MLCFYVDTMFALLIAFLCHRYRDAIGVNVVFNASFGIFGHGLAHLAIWCAPAREESDGATQTELLSSLLSAIPLGLFFFFILRTVPSMTQCDAAVHSSIHGVVLATMVPHAFGFSYVNNALMMSTVLYDLLRTKEKDHFYDWAAIIVHFPVTQLAWVEGFSCEPYMKSIGGHVWYDAITPLSMLIYLCVALSMQPKSKFR